MKKEMLKVKKNTKQKVVAKKAVVKTKAVPKKPLKKKVIKKDVKKESGVMMVKKEIPKKATILKAVDRKKKAKNSELYYFVNGSIIVFLGFVAIIFLINFFYQSFFALVAGKKLEFNFPVSNELVQEEVLVEDESEAENLDVDSLRNVIYFGEKEVTNNEVNESILVEDSLSGAVNLESREFLDLLSVTEDEVNNLSFLNSPDGSKFAVVVRADDKEAVLVNDELGPFYDAITFMVFSPNSKHLAYGAKVGNKEMVVLNNKEGKLYDWIFAPRFFSPDSNYFIYKARESAGDFLVFNEKESPVYERIYNPFVSDDKSAIIFYSRRGDTIYKSLLQL